MDASNITALVASASALVVSVVTSERQRRVATQANAFPLVVEVFREYRSDRFLEARRSLLDDLPGHDPARGFHGLPTELRHHVQTLSYFFDNLGVMVASGLVQPRLVAAFAGEAVERTWEQVLPFVEGERALRNFPSFQANFANLVEVLKHHPAGPARASLPLWRLGRQEH